MEAEQNHGTPTKNGLIKLRQAYEKAGNSFRAAETLELQTELYPSPDNYNKIGVLYSNAGVEDKAIEYYERAYQNNPNSSTINFNLGHSLFYKDPQRAKQLLNKAYEKNPSDGAIMIMYAKIERQAGNSEKAKEIEEKAYEMLIKKWKTETLASHEYSWLSSLASNLGHNDIAYQVRQSQPGLETEQYYETDNLTKTSSQLLENL